MDKKMIAKSCFIGMVLTLLFCLNTHAQEQIDRKIEEGVQAMNLRFHSKKEIMEWAKKEIGEEGIYKDTISFNVNGEKVLFLLGMYPRGSTRKQNIFVFNGHTVEMKKI